jgi:6,7-dimethyl-8-ribityllumazine synthase
MNVIDSREKNTSTFPVTLIVSRFNEAVTDKLLKSAMSRLEELGFESDLITVLTVPGAVEIPLTAKLIAKQKKSEAIIALGAVIRGETSHYDYVCSQVSQGCQQVALDFSIPVVFGVLTTENQQQALDRAGGVHSDKGKESVDVASEMVNLLRRL